MEGQVLRRARRGGLAFACALVLAGCQVPVRPDAPAAVPAPPASEDAAVAQPDPAPIEPEPAAPTAEPTADAPPPLPAMGHGQAVFDRNRKGLSPNACETGASSVRWPGSVPRSTTATGWSGGRPSAISRSAMRGSVRTPM